MADTALAESKRSLSLITQSAKDQTLLFCLLDSEVILNSYTILSFSVILVPLPLEDLPSTGRTRALFYTHSNILSLSSSIQF